MVADGVLERVERHTIGFARHRERLLAAGRHLRRGLLLHGRPGRVDLVVEGGDVTKRLLGAPPG